MLTSILCNNVPGELNDRETLLEHFGQFGLVQRVTCNPKRKSATIHFQDHVSGLAVYNPFLHTLHLCMLRSAMTLV